VTLGGDGRACPAAQEGALEAQETAEAGSSRGRGKLPIPSQRRARKKTEGVVEGGLGCHRLGAGVD
jgi:hypothetical protein